MSSIAVSAFSRISAGILLLSLAAHADERIPIDYMIGGPVPAPVVRKLVSTGAPLSVTMVFGGGPWLEASLSSPVTPTEVTITIKPAELAVGSYQGFVNVSAGPINTISYSIALTVTAGGAAAPTLTVFPPSLNLTVAEGESLLPQRINLSSSGEAVEYSLTPISSPPWLDVIGDKLLPDGSEGGRAPGYFFVFLTSKTLPPAVYNGRIVVTAPTAANHTITIPVTLTVTRGSAVPGAATVTKVLPQFVFGGGWYTAIYLGNSGAAAATATTQFFSDEGVALNVPGSGTSTSTVIPARGAAVIEAADIGPLTSGWAKVVIPAGVTGYAVFRQSVSGGQSQEAVVPLSSLGSQNLRMLFDERTFETAGAMLNTFAGSAVVTVSARDHAGVLIGSSTLTLKANAKTALRFRDLPELTLMQGQRGTIEIGSTQTGLAGLGLRFNGGALTSIPVSEP